MCGRQITLIEMIDECEREEDNIQNLNKDIRKLYLVLEPNSKA